MPDPALSSGPNSDRLSERDRLIQETEELKKEIEGLKEGRIANVEMHDVGIYPRSVLGQRFDKIKVSNTDFNILLWTRKDMEKIVYKGVGITK